MKKLKNIFSFLILIITLCGCAKDEVETRGTIYGIVNDADNGRAGTGRSYSS